MNKWAIEANPRGVRTDVYQVLKSEGNELAGAALTGAFLSQRRALSVAIVNGFRPTTANVRAGGWSGIGGSIGAIGPTALVAATQNAAPIVRNHPQEGMVRGQSRRRGG